MESEPSPQPKQAWEMNKQQFQDNNFGRLTEAEKKTVDLSDIEPRETGKTVDPKLVAAYKNGEPVPPVELIPKGNGKYEIDEGHHRYLAAKEAGLKNVDAIIAKLDENGNVRTHRQIVSDALSESKPVPPDVLKDYPELGKEAGKTNKFGINPKSGMVDPTVFSDASKAVVKSIKDYHDKTIGRGFEWLGDSLNPSPNSYDKYSLARIFARGGDPSFVQPRGLGMKRFFDISSTRYAQDSIDWMSKQSQAVQDEFLSHLAGTSTTEPQSPEMKRAIEVARNLHDYNRAGIKDELDRINERDHVGAAPQFMEDYWAMLWKNAKDAPKLLAANDVRHLEALEAGGTITPDEQSRLNDLRNKLSKLSPADQQAIKAATTAMLKRGATAGFLMQKIITTPEQMAWFRDVVGMKPRYDNPMQMQVEAAKQQANYIAQLQIINDLADAGMLYIGGSKDEKGTNKNGTPKFVPREKPSGMDFKTNMIMHSIEGGYDQPHELWTDRQTGNMLNNIVSGSLGTKTGFYNLIRDVGGSMITARLFSPYHLINIGIQSFAQPLSEGKPGIPFYSTGREGIRMQREADQYFRSLMGEAVEAKDGDFDRIKSFIGAGGDAYISRIFGTKVGQILSYPMQKAVFEQVQKMKLGAWDISRMADRAAKAKELGRDLTPQEEREVDSRALDNTSDRFGLMERDNLFWNKFASNIANGLMLSPTWNLGDVRQIWRAFSGDAHGKLFNSSNRWVLSTLVTTAAINAGIQYLIYGNKPPDGWGVKDLMMPQYGQDEQGRTLRASPIGYPKEWLQIAHAVARGAQGDVAGGVGEITTMASHKMSPWIGTAKELGTNKDFYSRKIYGEGGMGLGAYAAHSYEPFPVSAAQRNQEMTLTPSTKSTIKNWALPTLGWNPLGSTFKKSNAELKLQDILGDKRSPEGMTADRYDQSQALSKIKRLVELRTPLLTSGKPEDTAKAQSYTDQIRALVKEHGITEKRLLYLKGEIGQPFLVTGSRTLTIPEVMPVVKLMKPDEYKLVKPYLDKKLKSEQKAGSIDSTQISTFKQAIAKRFSELAKEPK